jgi:hypothetical protein
MPAPIIDDQGFLSDVWWMPKVNSSRADVDPKLLLEHIYNKGIIATWWAAARCPCGTPGRPADPDCPVCRGDGWDFFASQVVRVLAVGLRTDLSLFEKANLMIPGSGVFCVRPEHSPAFMDRLVLEHSRITLSEMRVRRATLDDPIEQLSYPIVGQPYRRAPTDEEPNPEPGMIDVLLLRAQDADGLVGDPLVNGEDFEIGDGGTIDWSLGDAAGTAPPVGKQFSIYYKTRPVYRVTSDSHVVRDTMTKWKVEIPEHQYLPVQFQAKLEWNWRADEGA